MQKLCFATCQEYPDIYDDDKAFADLIANHIGEINLHAHPWDDQHVHWDIYDAVIIRSCWGYHTEPKAFDQWLTHLKEKNVKTINDTELVRWNLHKSYLQDIANWGIATLPTIFTKPTEYQAEQLNTAFSELETDKIIVKPCVSAGSENTILLHQADDLTAAHQLCRERDMMIQAYSPDLVETGEISLFYFGNSYSHAVVKTPKSGDFRSQPGFGSTVEAFEPADHIKETAEKLLSKTTPTYARIDGVDINGVFHIIEFEVIEPDLFMKYAKADSPALAAKAILSAL